ncbi:Collagen triple helix and C1q domain containing protein [Pandoravirus macleodensis]|uniref:Collagen triple helix and C1q domain containing protein n=1 Tax=Pandoravirus macleodensis TaxID=2107707 RepID=A0A2U7UF17_9VIRU|nr:Collagen triple helix and C1q domain containing protein [Pandoravirus macleodensis]AVK77034.1 Collagen triple helix and C1q domain containing protein [Pandoravirus macleodensis]
MSSASRHKMRPDSCRHIGQRPQAPPCPVVNVPGQVGPAGASGAEGTPGPPGALGSVGPVGVQGIRGPVGPTGNPGASGALGPVGPVGPQAEAVGVGFGAHALAQAFPLNTVVTVVFTIEDYDLQANGVADNYDPTTSVFTAPLAGVYQFDVEVSIQINSGSRNILVALVTDSGAPPIERWFTLSNLSAPTDFQGATVSGGFVLAPGQTVRVEASAVGTGVATLGSQVRNTFTGHMISPVLP